MPKKLFGPLEPPVILEELLAEFLAADEEFVLKTDDPVAPTFANELIDVHYPSQAQLPID